MEHQRLNLLDFKAPRIRLLHLSWAAFFITFLVWFSHAPLLAHIREVFDLSKEQVKALLILNVALTIPARVIIGSLVDRYGPRLVFSSLLVLGSIPCYLFAFSESYTQLALSRLALGFVGAGFVVGIRLISEWFPAREVGLAEGVYGGWGNFGSAAGAITLPTIALLFGGESGWRYAIALTGTIALLYGIFFYTRARNTPKGSEYFKPKKTGALEVSNYRDLYFYIGMNIPMYAALAVLIWRLGPTNLGLYDLSTQVCLFVFIAMMGAYQLHKIWHVNNEHLKEGVPEYDHFKFKQVAILDLAYLVTFGSELAVVSMLPLFFMDTFSLNPVTAGLLASGYAFMNLVARPGGGWLSDKFGRKKTLMILLVGLTVGYFVLSNIDSGWPVLVAMAATMACSFFVQAGEGAVFATVPLVKRRLTGQIAGMVGAYGNVGAVCFLTVLTFVEPAVFFMVIAGCACVTLIAVNFLDEPEGHIAEVGADGQVQLIEVN